jgi:hypothetical protein
VAFGTDLGPRWEYWASWVCLDHRWPSSGRRPPRSRATLELGFNGSQVQAKVVEPHDPPLRGAEHDRVTRNGESYVKDFKPLILGIIDLTKGRGPLAIRAIKIPGRRVIDLRAVVLTLIE